MAWWVPRSRCGGGGGRIQSVVNALLRLLFPFWKDNLKALIVENIIWGVGSDAVASQITAYVQSLNVNYQISAMEVSDDDITYLEVVSTALPIDRFTNDITRITIT